jgi:ABC-2 type transport system ATP-binding protein
MIQVEGLTKRYARQVAVDNISFSVGKGEIVGFLGPNGAGKTTTMRVLTCFMPPTEGKASVAGYDVYEHAMEVKRHIGYLPEAPPLYPEMEVGDYLRFVGRLKGIPSSELERRVNEVADRCAIGDVKTKLITKLSKGYRQRVGLAQAIIHNPDVLILDEPTSGLDPKQILETRELIKSLSGEHTIILSTHILPEVEAICQKVIIIDKGKLVATDTVENLTHRMHGSDAALVAISADGVSDPPAVQQRLEQVRGVSKVVARPFGDGRLTFEVESLPNQNVRADLARAVVQSGWDLLELKSLAYSLEEVFLELTASETQGVNE